MGSSTHPLRSARIAAISNGYFDLKRNGEKVESTIAKKNNVNTSDRIENSAPRTKNIRLTKKKENESWSIYHDMCSDNGKFWVTVGQETSFCIACRREYHLRWSGGTDIMTGKPYVLVYMETKSSSMSRILESQGW